MNFHTPPAEPRDYRTAPDPKPALEPDPMALDNVRLSSRVAELVRENAELREVAERLAKLRSVPTGRIDLTDSSKRAEVYALVARAEEILK